MKDEENLWTIEEKFLLKPSPFSLYKDGFSIGDASPANDDAAHSNRHRGTRSMSQVEDERQRLLNKIQKEMEKLWKEFQELRMLKETVDEINCFRLIHTETCEFD